ncbi:ABC transporter ATP-binding protein [Nonomuraea sp. NPDC059194]|uniref:ABC transporter ATP-binding protein n=1 Tax=Nonomuraea sp. NPDC059194 TaxID=3346764 RepID=UPI0036BAF435
MRRRDEIWLDGIDLELSSGLTVLLGPLGAGKSTLMRVMAGLQPLTTGRVIVKGKDVSAISVRKRSVAFVYQQFINYPSLTVHENIASPLRLDSAFPNKDVDRRVREVAELMGLGDLLDRRPAELSGGQQQRTAIARALARPVDVLLLDEPLANLDYKLREQLRGDLRRRFAGSPSVVVYSTADPAEALGFAAPTVVLGEGRVQHVGDAADMYDRPPTLAVAAALSDPPLNLLPGIVRDGRIECMGASVPAPREYATGRHVVLGVRPHQVSIDSAVVGALAFPAEIRLAEVTGSATFLHLLLRGDRHLVAQVKGTRPVTPGEPATAYVDPAHVLVFDEAGARLTAGSTTGVDPHG